MTPNQKAFLDMLACSEIGPALLALSDNGYNVLVGSTPAHPLLFNSYADHPNILNAVCNSTAAGRYQILHRYYIVYREQLHLDDKTLYPDGPFGKAAQDAIAMQLIKECHALDAIEAGDIETAIHLCRSRWASLPGAGYGQHENKLDVLTQAYTDAGGIIA
jgi:muramidase (phage lysozyme)